MDGEYIEVRPVDGSSVAIDGVIIEVVEPDTIDECGWCETGLPSYYMDRA